MLRTLLAAVLFPLIASSVAETPDSLGGRSTLVGWDNGPSYKKRFLGKYWLGVNAFIRTDYNESTHDSKIRSQTDSLPVFDNGFLNTNSRHFRMNLVFELEKRLFKGIFVNPYIMPGYGYSTSHSDWRNTSDYPPVQSSNNHGLRQCQ